MSVQIRPPQPGDGEDMAQVWLSAAAYYAELEPALFQVPSADGLAGSFEADIAAADEGADGPVAVSFYERHMGYQRRQIGFAKSLS
jgi:hypothetical protein